MTTKRKTSSIRIDNKKKRTSERGGTCSKKIDPEQCIYFFTSWRAVRQVNECSNRKGLELDTYVLPIRVIEVVRDSNTEILHAIYGESTVKADGNNDFNSLFPRHLKKQGKRFMFHITKPTGKRKQKSADQIPLKVEFIKEIAEGDPAYEVQRKTMCGCLNKNGNADKKCHFDRCAKGHLIQFCRCDGKMENNKSRERDYDSQDSPILHDDPEKCEVQFYTWLVLPAINKYLEDNNAITPTIMSAKEVEMNILYGESTFKRGKTSLKILTRENNCLKPGGRRFKFHVKCFWNNCKRWRKPDKIEIHVTKKVSPEQGQLKPINFYCGEDCDYFTH